MFLSRSSVSLASQLFKMQPDLPLSPLLTHVVHDGGLSSLTIQVNHSIDAGRDVPGCRALSHAVHEEVEAAIFLPHYAHCVTSLQDGKKGF